MKKRIWELDAARGAALLAMVAVHLIYDLNDLTGLVQIGEPEWFRLLKNHGGAVFLLISGICATLGSRSVRRGAQVFACGVVCTAATAGVYLLGLSDETIIIWFGALHCLGVCMMLWGRMEKWSDGLLALLGAGMAALGLAIAPRGFRVPWWMIPTGFCPEWFQSPDFFPLLPNLGYFLLGAVLGRRVYGRKETRFPGVEESAPLIRGLCALGRHSLPIYLLHQPILLAITFVVASVAG